MESCSSTMHSFIVPTIVKIPSETSRKIVLVGSLTNYFWLSQKTKRDSLQSLFFKDDTYDLNYINFCPNT